MRKKNAKMKICTTSLTTLIKYYRADLPKFMVHERGLLV